jgi:CRISPR-associated endonuclease/helicase Cas3
MPEGTIHLSALMCGEERSDIIADIKEKLKSEKKHQLRVVSTQIVEAGVDIDFPVVYRAFAGLDSLAQAAGRCNREDSPKKGHFFVFTPPNLPKIGLMLKGAQAAQSVIGEGFEKFDPTLYEKYFSIFYSRVNDTDKPEFKTLMKNDAQSFEFQFRTFAQNFCLIDEEEQKSVIVRYKGKNNDSNILIDRLKKEPPHRELMRKLQRFTVNIYDYHFKKLFENYGISEMNGYFVLESGVYEKGKGVVGEDENIMLPLIS